MDSPWQKDTTKLFSSQYYLNRIYATKYIFYGIRPFYIKHELVDEEARFTLFNNILHYTILLLNELRKVKLNVSTNFSRNSKCSLPYLGWYKSFVGNSRQEENEMEQSH